MVRGRVSCARPQNCCIAYGAQFVSTAGGVESSSVERFAATAGVRGTDRQTSGAILMPVLIHVLTLGAQRQPVHYTFFA